MGKLDKSVLGGQQDTIRRAIQVFLDHAYVGPPPDHALRFLPPEENPDICGWLMSDLVERSPSNAPLEDVRSFALRIGCSHYRHMKMRISRPGARPDLVFTVDSHDVFLDASPGTPDYEGLQQLKRLNANMASRITEAWDSAGLKTERAYLREAIRAARERKRSSET
jgi:hypothetical protein